MSFLFSELLRCPMDQTPLQVQGRSLLCQQGHSFDIARRGYVNLLGAGDKRSRDPGDSKEMVVARQGFLNGGHYQAIAERVFEVLAPLLPNRANIVDAGCGEGYYLEQLRTGLASAGYTPAAMIGFDISKWAVQAATRRLAITWLVASNRNIPLAAGSIDCLLSMFGFPVFDTFLAALADDGVLLTVNAGPQHLIELREVLYPRITHTESSVVTQAQAAGFTAGDATSLTLRTAPLSQLEINQLLGMTPHLFRATREGRKRSALLDQFPVTIDVVLQLLHKGPRR